MRLKLFVLLILIQTINIQAKEGMWIPLLLETLNEKDMQSMGMNLSAEDLYSINHSSLKDAIVHFGGGCTAEVISDQGLILTNHHCGYSSIQDHSSVDHDYLTDGYWAKDLKQELKNDGLTATFIVRIEDVTDLVLEGISDTLNVDVRNARIAANIEIISKKSIGDSHYESVIKPFYYGNKFYLFLTETFKDVRLVGAPPSSIGKFGGDTDNWMWPRHTGDFSIFRIYANKENKPAEYSEDNVPYTPKHYLPISMKGVKEDDFTMVYGFPGRTQQYLTSYAVDHVMNYSNPVKIKMRKKILDILDVDMMGSDKVRIQYASKYARVSNYWKKWIGENRGLKKLNAIEKKKELESEFKKRLAEKGTYDPAYNSILDRFNELYLSQRPYALWRDQFIEFIYSGPEAIRYANTYMACVNLASTNNLSSDELNQSKLKLSESSEKFFKNFNSQTDRKLMISMMEMFGNNIPDELQPEFIKTVKTKYKGNYSKYVTVMYEKSIMANEEKMKAFNKSMNISGLKKLKKDPLYQLMEEFYAYYLSVIRGKFSQDEEEIEKLNRIYMKALMEVMPDVKNYYPDANSTLRVSYGKVEGYEPANGVNYRYYSTLDGIMEKEVPGSKEFTVPEKLKQLYQDKDFGDYSENDTMRVCFVASNHTTGGNSGSPVLDKDGYLIGLNFDRAWESTMSDIMYDPERCRNIIVDIRYVLFIIDKFAGATNLINELFLISEKEEMDLIIQRMSRKMRDNLWNSNYYNVRGNAHFKKGEYEAALTDFRKASTLEPSRAEFYFKTAMTYRELDNEHEALSNFTTAILTDKNYKNGYFYRGIWFADHQKYKEAIEDFNQVIKMDPKDPQAYHNRGICKNMMNSDESGCDDIKKALQLGDQLSVKVLQEFCQ